MASRTVLYTGSLSTTPLTEAQLEKLDATQWKMMRRMVGWVLFSDDTWETAGRRMKDRLLTATTMHPIKAWSERRHGAREQIGSYLIQLMPGTSSRSLCLDAFIQQRNIQR